MLEANVPVKVASERLGHSSVSITGDLYTHVLEGMQREVARNWTRWSPPCCDILSGTGAYVT
jgi:integrase